jgi:hypothetical protein
MSIDRYNRLKVLDRNFLPIRTKSFIPTPTDSDYVRGYITRFFTQKANDRTSTVIEVNSKGFSNYTNNPFYITTSLDWIISGDISEVEDYNLKSIRFASKNFKALPYYLQNLTQFLKK